MRLLVSIVLAVAICSTVLAAEPPRRARLHVDAAAPLFAARDLRPGERRAACTTVRNAGDAPGRVALYAGGARGPLAPHLDLEVFRGCAGERRLWHGTLAEFPAAVEGAVLDTPWAPGEARAYRFELRLGADPAAEGLTAAWDWRLAVETVAAASARSAAAPRCERVRVAGRKLVRTVKLSHRVRAVLVLRRSGRRVTATTGLRVRGDKTLVIPRWARVRYAVNGRAAKTARRRPFQATLPTGKLAAGRTRVTVTVRPRKGRRRTTTFRLRVRRAGGTCVVRA